MTNSAQPSFLGWYGAWYRALADVVQTQWSFLDAQCQFGMQALDALRGSPAAEPKAGAGRREGSGPLPTLEKRARERTDRGLSPPRDIYEVQNRNRIDWAELPEWARPSDPELFEGAHEG